ncbi:hypothetical protein [Paracoccus sp. SSK6]|uniref:hypothetical protein n=1 Tax=Paracoccus sp. SSK6 TaxID=3143131 RepID=UPI00321A2CC9
MHEAGGAGRRVFALYQALRHPGPPFWILRSPCLVLADPQEPFSLTAGCRLQLAVEAGRTKPSETRWHCRPIRSPRGQVLHAWRLLRNKRGIPKAWALDWTAGGQDAAIRSEAAVAF